MQTMYLKKACERCVAAWYGTLPIGVQFRRLMRAAKPQRGQDRGAGDNVQILYTRYSTCITGVPIVTCIVPFIILIACEMIKVSSPR